MVKFFIIAALICWFIYRAARRLPNWILSKETVRHIDQTIHHLKTNIFALCIGVLILGASMLVYGLTR